MYVYIDDRPTDDRPLISKISNGHISATGRPIQSMFGSRLGFSGTADLMALFPVRIIQDGGRRHLGKISNGHISATGRPIHSMLGSRVGFSGTADLMALFPVGKIQDGAAAILRKFQMAISPQPVVRSTPCLVLGWGFRGRRI